MLPSPRVMTWDHSVPIGNQEKRLRQRPIPCTEPRPGLHLRSHPRQNISRTRASRSPNTSVAPAAARISLPRLIPSLLSPRWSTTSVPQPHTQRPSEQKAIMLSREHRSSCQAMFRTSLSKQAPAQRERRRKELSSSAGLLMMSPRSRAKSRSAERTACGDRPDRSTPALLHPGCPSSRFR